MPAIGHGDRIGALDGLRVFAVGSVLVSHAGFNHGGWVGVDTFFVLSGFLITCLLLAEPLDRTSLVEFWSRRFRRLLPAFVLMVMIITGLLMTDIVSVKADLQRVYAEGLWSMLYVGNWFEIVSGADYWNGFATSPFGHLWSLGIEEQFYVLFPLFVAGTARFGHRRRTLITLGLGITSAVWAITLFLLTSRRDRVYFGTDTRMFALLLGAAAAMILARPPVQQRVREKARTWSVLGLAALLLLVAASLFADGSKPWLYLGGLPLASTVSLVAVMGTVFGTGPLQALLDRPLLRWIGERSYGIYLWHLPVFVLLPSGIAEVPPFSLLPTAWAAPVATFVAGTAITCGIAAASFTFVETPLRRGAGTFRPRVLGRRLRVTGSAASLATIGGAFAILTGGLAFAVTTDAGGSGRAPTVDLAAFLPAAGANPAASGSSGAAGERIQSLMLVGDSIALSFGAFSDVQGLTIEARGFPGCGFLSANERFIEGKWEPWSDECNSGSTEYVKGIADFDATMLVWGRWDLSDVKWQGATYRLGTPEYETYLFTELDKYNTAAVSSDKTLYISSALCYAGGFDYLSSPRPEEMNELLKKYSLQHPNVAYLPLIDFVCRDGKPVQVNGEDLRPDTVHFSPEATSLVWRWMLPYLLGTRDPKGELQSAQPSVPAQPTGVSGASG